MKKSEKEIKVNPVHDYYDWENNFNYCIDGSVSVSQNKKDYKDLVDVLNLNSEVLKRKRKAALKGFLTKPVKLESGLIKREYIKYSQEEISKLCYVLREKSSDGMYFPYCEAIVDMLDLELLKERDKIVKDQIAKIKNRLLAEGVSQAIIKKVLGI